MGAVGPVESGAIWQAAGSCRSTTRCGACGCSTARSGCCCGGCAAGESATHEPAAAAAAAEVELGAESKPSQGLAGPGTHSTTTTSASAGGIPACSACCGCCSGCAARESELQGPASRAANTASATAADGLGPVSDPFQSMVVGPCTSSTTTSASASGTAGSASWRGLFRAPGWGEPKGRRSRAHGRSSGSRKVLGMGGG